jgi:hypothetical protein
MQKILVQEISELDLLSNVLNRYSLNKKKNPFIDEGGEKGRLMEKCLHLSFIISFIPSNLAMLFSSLFYLISSISFPILFIT